MPRHYMIDIETWDTAPTAVIRAIAIVGFDLSGETDLMAVIDCRKTTDWQLEAGATTSLETAEWWKKKADSLGTMLARTKKLANIDINQPTTADELLDAIEFSLHGVEPDDRIWSRGHFDIAILGSLLDAYGHPIPWRYHQVRDVRTLDEITPPVKSQMPHHPLADCLAQIEQVCSALRLAKAGTDERAQ